MGENEKTEKITQADLEEKMDQLEAINRTTITSIKRICETSGRTEREAE